MPFHLPPAISLQCRELIGAAIASIRPASGGDINQSYLLETGNGRFFIKLNAAPHAAHMFSTEAKGLQLLAAAGPLPTPAVIGLGETEDGAFLLLEYIETGYRAQGFWENFGKGLAGLHRHSASQFGLDYPNYIGSLLQSNNRHDTWPDFFICERLQPQLELAISSNRLSSNDFQNFEKLFKKIPALCPAEPPALIHGDLWSGNFLVSADSRPVLIDLSVAYSHREMDLAMSRLFGGFDRSFYRSYEEAFPLEPGFEERLPLYQLYYLLVHVNLFGGGYVGSVRGILQQFV